MARTPKGQDKSDARMKVQTAVSEYLEAKNIEFESTRERNLPVNKEGGINVSQICKDIGLSASQRTNHVYKDDDIKHEINRYAVAQDIEPMDSDVYKKTINAESRQMISMSAKRAKESQDQLVELQAANQQLLIENKKLKAMVEGYKAQIEAFYESGQLPSVYMGSE
jgi:hypothetical protein